ncbi:MAG: four helix bundle protein [Actinobacteria bacterium RBG_16_67_15]|nr:MAG: four helix bundle protein [Actinobacteria bacterium RBG_16_67_15]
MTDYRTLDVWKLAHSVTLSIYQATANYANDERFGLTAQTRRAATSIPSNIAEGAGRASDRDNRRFLAIAAGSVNETEYQLLLAKELGYLDPATWDDLARDLSRVRSMLTRLRQRLADD